MPLLALVVASTLWLSTPGDIPPEPVPSNPAVIRVISGRMSVIEGEKISMRSRGAAPLRVAGSAYLECGAGSEIEVVWRGYGSLRIRGNAALEWESSPIQTARTVVRVPHFSQLDVEVRRGGMALELPEGWGLEFDSAVMGLAGLSDGTVEARHRGGRPIRITSSEDRPDVGWPKRLVGGQSVRLPALRPSESDESEDSGEESGSEDRSRT